jgi:hypothetical protein
MFSWAIASGELGGLGRWAYGFANSIRSKPSAISLWKSDWVRPKKPAQYTLLSRAKDANANVQPDKHDENYASYVINHLLPIEVTVADPGVNRISNSCGKRLCDHWC